MNDLKATVSSWSRFVTQIIHFSGGNKRTIEGIDATTIKQGQYTKFETVDGKLIMINDNNVDMIECFKENGIGEICKTTCKMCSGLTDDSPIVFCEKERIWRFDCDDGMKGYDINFCPFCSRKLIS